MHLSKTMYTSPAHSRIYQIYSMEFIQGNKYSLQWRDKEYRNGDLLPCLTPCHCLSPNSWLCPNIWASFGRKRSPLHKSCNDHYLERCRKGATARTVLPEANGWGAVAARINWEVPQFPHLPLPFFLPPTPECSGPLYSPVSASDFPVELYFSADGGVGAGTERARRRHADHGKDNISEGTWTFPSVQGLKWFSVIPIANDHTWWNNSGNTEQISLFCDF